MSRESFKARTPESVRGRFYVTEQCLDCDLCRETAPENFARNDDGGYSYVKKQPESAEEEALCRGALAGCCTEAIHDDGFDFDWTALPAPTPYHLTPEGQAQHAQWRESDKQNPP
ncbi:MAG: ferredoxin [Verrucomicrobiota bacterium]